MINTPPPTLPGAAPAGAAAVPTTAITLDVQSVSPQLAALLAALKQQATLAITKAELDTAKQLLTLTTPQGAVTIKLPPASASIPFGNGAATSTALPQTIPLAQVFSALTAGNSPTPASQLKNTYLQFDRPASAGEQPPLRLLFNIQDFLQSPRPVIAPTAPQEQGFNNAGLIRTTLTQLPESAVKALGLLTMPATTGAAGDSASAPPNNTTGLPALAALAKAKISSLVQNITGANSGNAPTVTPATGATTAMTNAQAPKALNVNLPVMVLNSADAQTTAAQVLGATPKGEAILRAESGQIFSLNNVRAQNIGSTVHLKNVAPLPAGFNAVPPASNDLHSLLQEAVHSLHVPDAAMAARLGQQLQATPGPQLGGALLLIFSVLGGGALTNKTYNRSGITLDDALAKHLPDGTKTRLLNLLQEDPISLTRLVTDQVNVEWRGQQIPTPPLPGFTGPVWFYVQQQQPDTYADSSARDGKDIHPTRFVIDLDLSQLGHTQLEGISTPQKLDLKINTGTALPAAMQEQLTSLYANTLSAYGLYGALGFSTDAPLDLDEPAAAMQVLS